MTKPNNSAKRYARADDADDAFDRYYTPAWATRALLDNVSLSAGRLVAEPCAGEGHIVDVLEENDLHVEAGDLNRESPYFSDNPADATNPRECRSAYEGCTAVVTNPPYNAESGAGHDVINACRFAMNYEYPVYALFRLSFLEPADSRESLLTDLSRVIILPRVHFSGPALSNKASGPGETSAWFCWEPYTDGPKEVELVTKRERDHYQGQERLFGG